MRPILFSFGRLNFYSYGFFTALGFIAAGAVIDYLAKRKKIITNKHREYFLIDALLFSLVIAIVSGRLGYILLYHIVFAVEPFDLTRNVLSGGFIFYVGLLAGLSALAWWLKRSNVSILPWFDVVMVGVPVGLTFSEVGGYFNDGQVVHIVMLLGNILIAIVGYHLLFTEKKAGKTFLVTILLLFLLFFFAGFWQTERIYWVGLTLTQWISLLGIFGFYRTLNNLIMSR